MAFRESDDEWRENAIQQEPKKCQTSWLEHLQSQEVVLKYP